MNSISLVFEVLFCGIVALLGSFAVAYAVHYINNFGANHD